MSFRTNTVQQVNLNDRLNNLTGRERSFLDKSWATPFAERIFPLINESKFRVLYCEDNGRPNTPVNVIVGALFLKEMTGITDEELLECIILDPRYQHALHLTSCDEMPFSDRTVSRFREKLYWHEIETGEDLLKEEIEYLASEFTAMMGIHGNLKRMDSLMVSSNCKNMGRLELIYTCVSNLVKALVKSGESAILPDHMLQYAEGSNKNAFCYRLEKEEVQTRLESVTADAMILYELAGELQGGNDEYALLERMLADQTKAGKLKPNNQIKPDSLQNPSDEEATFRRKAGKGHHGYVGNFVEDCGENGNIITHYDYTANTHSDVEFGAEIIEKLGKQDERTTVVTDGAYASNENFEAAEENNIELVTTTLTGKKPPEIVLDFEIEEDVIRSCPEGFAPTASTYDEKKEEYCAEFDKDVCKNCPRKDECPAIVQKKKAKVKLSKATIIRANYIKKLDDEEYKAYARKRNGVEGIPSVLRRRYGVDQIPVRGLVRSKMWFGFKIGAINIKRVIAAILNIRLNGILWGFSGSNAFRATVFCCCKKFPCWV